MALTYSEAAAINRMQDAGVPLDTMTVLLTLSRVTAQDLGRLADRHLQARDDMTVTNTPATG